MITKSKTMTVYRKTKSGYIEQLETVGSYCPKGWSKTKEAAERRK